MKTKIYKDYELVVTPVMACRIYDIKSKRMLPILREYRRASQKECLEELKDLVNKKDQLPEIFNN